MLIQIELKLFVTLSKYLPENNNQYEIAGGMTVEMLIKSLEIPRELVKLIFINGKRESEIYQLQNNDRVGIFPAVGGG
jgi:molybdopterin synthase sulfur carrier subunit